MAKGLCSLCPNSISRNCKSVGLRRWLSQYTRAPKAQGLHGQAFQPDYLQTREDTIPADKH